MRQVSQYQNVYILDFTGAKDDVGSGDNWSCETCNVPVKSSSPTNQHPVVYRPDVLPVTQLTLSEHWREMLRKECKIMQWHSTALHTEHWETCIIIIIIISIISISSIISSSSISIGCVIWELLVSEWLTDVTDRRHSMLTVSQQLLVVELMTMYTHWCVMIMMMMLVVMMVLMMM